MSSSINLGCTSCNKKFEKLEDLNKHIVKTGHNESQKILISDILAWCGVKIEPDSILNMSLKIFKSFGKDWQSIA